MSDYLMRAENAIALLDRLCDHGVDVCVGGGWGVDALLRRQTRPHSDLDLWLPAADLERLFTAFVASGVDRIFPWPGDRPWNFVLHDGLQLRVDLHIYERIADGSIHYGPVVDGAVFPGEALAGEGTILGAEVTCESAEWAVWCHTGYPPRAVDRHDVALLCERFGLDLLEGYD